MSEEPGVTPEVAEEMRARFFEQVLVDLENKTEAWQLIIVPLGDAVGFRVEMHVTDGGETMFLAGASNASALTAGSMAIGRGLARIEQALSEAQDEESEENSREQ